MITRLFNWVKSHQKLSWLIAFSLLALLILSGYGFVNVKGESLNGAEITLQKSNGSQKGIKPGFNIVPKGQYNLVAKNKDMQTEKNVTVTSLSFTNIAVLLQPQKNGSKIASKGQGCVLPTSTPTSTYTVSCGAITPFIEKYTFTDRPVISKEYDKPVYAPTPYGEGALGFATTTNEDDSLQLVYFKNGQIIPLNYALDAAADMANISIHVLASGDKTTGFAVLDAPNKKILFFDETNNPIAETSLKDSGITKYTANQFNGTLFVVAAPVTNSRNSENEFLKGGSLRKFVISDSSVKEESTLLIPEDISLFGLRAIGKDVGTTRDINGKITVFTLGTKQIEKIDEIPSTNHFTTWGETIVYSKGGDIFTYSYRDRTSYLLYRFDVFTPAYLQTITSSLYISAVDTFTGVLHTFSMSEKEIRTDHTEKVLSYPKKLNSVVRYIDIMNGRVYAELNLVSFTSDHETGQFLYDESEVNAKRKTLLEQLRQDGVNVPPANIVTE